AALDATGPGVVLVTHAVERTDGGGRLPYRITAPPGGTMAIQVVPGVRAMGWLSTSVNEVTAAGSGFHQRPSTTWPPVNTQAGPSPTRIASGTGVPTESRAPVSR